MIATGASGERPLDGVIAKLVRAQDHVDAFTQAYRDAIDADPVGFELAPGASVGELVARVEYVPALPPAVGVRLGDALHNFRSSLDHLVWQLAVLNTPEPFDKTQFPIADTPEEFSRQGWRIPDLRDEHRNLVEHFQPYNRGGDASPLEQLRDLSNTDKHRVINPMLVTPTLVGIDFTASNCTVEEVTPLSGYALQVGTAFARIRVPPECTDPRVQMSGHLIPDVMLDSQSSLELLRRIGAEIVMIAQEAERDLEPRPLLTRSPRRWPSFSTYPFVRPD